MIMVCTHTHACTHTHMHAHIHARMHSYTHACTHGDAEAPPEPLSCIPQRHGAYWSLQSRSDWWRPEPAPPPPSTSQPLCSSSGEHATNTARKDSPFWTPTNTVETLYSRYSIRADTLMYTHMRRVNKPTAIYTWSPLPFPDSLMIRAILCAWFLVAKMLTL